MVYLLLENGFEEIEALSCVDILRRSKVDIKIVSEYEYVKSNKKVSVKRDCSFEEIDFENTEMVIIPGGMPGADNLRNNKKVIEILNFAFENNRFIGAICAAPYILGQLGFLKGKKAVCYPGFEAELKGAFLSDEKVVKDENIITAVGMGASLEFALKLLECLKGKEEADRVAGSIMMQKVTE